MRGSGGTEGGLGLFTIGFLLALLGAYFFFDSVRAEALGVGAISRMFGRHGGGGGLGLTTSMGVILVPFFIGVIALFYDVKMRWAWALTLLGVVVLVIEILSSLRFRFELKVTHLLGMILLFSAGTGLMLRSYRDDPQPATPKEPPADT